MTQSRRGEFATCLMDFSELVPCRSKTSMSSMYFMSCGTNYYVLFLIQIYQTNHTSLFGMANKQIDSAREG
jgi:hypothetical protein